MTDITNTPIGSLTISDLIIFAFGIVVAVVLASGIYYTIFRKSIEEQKAKRSNKAWMKEAIQNGADPEWVNKMTE